MDPWQTSVEKRLENIGARVGAVEVGIATLSERVAHLPTKEWITARLQIYLGIMVAVSAIAIGLTKLI